MYQGKVILTLFIQTWCLLENVRYYKYREKRGLHV